MPPYLRPMGPAAATAILCGDPARALMIAQRLMVEPKMSNHHRGLWSYGGTTAAGAELTVQATGIGGPSAALVLSLLARAGLRSAVRVGTCRSLSAEPSPGAGLIADRVRAEDGASGAYGAKPGELLLPDRELTGALLEPGEAAVELTSLDRPVLEAGSAHEARDGGIFDLQSAALLAAGRQAGVRVAISAVISRNPDGPLADESLEAAVLKLAERGASALRSAAG